MRTKISVHALPWLLLALGLALAIRQWIWVPGLISGESMQPTLRSGQLVWINKLVYFFDMPRRGDIVEFWTGREFMVKRVLGLPGDQIAVRGGIFYVNGTPLTEPYVQSKDNSNIAPGRLSPDHFVVAGDNRSQTIIAVVNRKRIVGRVLRQQHAAQVAAIALP
jgi:signal peptidase I